MGRWGFARRRRVVALALAVAAAPVVVNAHVTGPMSGGYSDKFDYPQTPAELDRNAWQVSPEANNVWMVEPVTTSGAGASSTIKALRQKTTASVPLEPIAFVRNEAGWENMIIQVRAAFEGASQDSGVGIVFRSPVDPLTHTADRNNFYLFTSVVTAASSKPEGFATGRGFALFKRVGGQYYSAAKKDTYLSLAPANANSMADAHDYKVIIATSADTERARILCYVDGVLMIDVTDHPDDDGGRLPGPMFAGGTVGLRTARTKAWFDDFTVIASPAYEARAAAMTFYGQVGNGSRTSLPAGNVAFDGVGVAQAFGDTGFQYHNHDFPQPGSTEGTAVSPLSPSNGVILGAILQTSGQAGVASATAQILGGAGSFVQSLPDGTTVDIVFDFDAISAFAAADCLATRSEVSIASLVYTIVVRTPSGEPIINEYKGTQFNPPPNTVASDPATNGGYVRVTLNWQLPTAEPRRTDAAAIRIDILDSAAEVVGPSTPAGALKVATGATAATIMIGHVTAGRLCNNL